MDKIIVTVSGIAAIIFIAWFFFAGQKAEHEMHHEH